MSFEIKIISGDSTDIIYAENETLLYDALTESGAELCSPCGGNGRCLKCKVKAYGRLSAPTEKEKQLFPNGEYRLACKAYALGDVTVYTESAQSVSHGQEEEGGYCISVTDIGTTSIETKFFDFDGREKGFERYINPLIKYGADIVTRIERFSQSGKEAEKLLKQAISDIEEKNGYIAAKRYFTGNTAMLHLLTGRSTQGFCSFPFAPETLFGYGDGYGEYLPCISAFLGADAVCAAGAALGSNGAEMVIDIGTNTEIILFDGKNYIACSAPAGPAFEGAEITNGMNAAEGAIYDVEPDGDEARVFTVNGAPAKGICGSGLTAVCDYLYNNGYVLYDGTPLKNFPLFGGIAVTPEDVAKFLTAKAAIRAGAETLLAVFGVKKRKNIYLAGNFGSNLNICKAVRTGIIPSEYADITHPIGNAALEGASKAAFDKDFYEKIRYIAENTKALELANEALFPKLFIENIRF